MTIRGYCSFFVLTCLSGLTVNNATAEDCNRACLETFADQYFKALAAHDANKLPVTRDVKYTENSEVVKLGSGFWQNAGEATYRMEIFDPDTGGIGILAVVNEIQQNSKQDLVIAMVRMKVENAKVSEIETILSRRKISYGDLWGAENLKELPPDFTQLMKPADQNSRLELIAAADAYWRAFETNGTENYHPAPLMPNTLRLENGVQTTNRKVGQFGPFTATEQFDRGLFRGGKIYDRRYPVVDTELGVVLAIVRFGRQDWLDPNVQVSSTGNLDFYNPLVAEFFAVKAGKITDINVVLTRRPKGSPTNW